MARRPLCVDISENCPCRSGSRKATEQRYRVSVVVLTYLAYTTYHLSRKPISVVKSALHCENQTYNSTDTGQIVSKNCTQDTHQADQNPDFLCYCYKPFDEANYTTLLGSLDTSFLFAYAVAMFFSGHIAERSNLRYFLTVGMLLSGVFTSLFGLAKYWHIHSMAYFIVIQVLGGICQATGWPTVVACMANWFGKGRRGFIMGLWNSHTSVGNILGSVIAGVFVHHHWGLSFIVPGAIIAGMGVIIFLTLVPDPQDVGCSQPDHGNKVVSASLGESIQAENDPEDEQEPLIEAETSTESKQAITFFAALRIPGVVEFSLCLFFSKLVSYTFLFWLPFYISKTADFIDKGTGNANEKAADLSTVFDFGGIAGAMIAGAVSDYTGGRATTCMIFLFFAAPMLFVYEQFGRHSLALSIGLLFVCGSLVNGPYGLITTAVSADLGTHQSLHGNAKALATVTAIIDGTGSIGAAIGPLLTGVISGGSTLHKSVDGDNEDNSWKNVFYMLIAADILALLLLARLTHKEIQGWRTSCAGGSRLQQGDQ